MREGFAVRSWYQDVQPARERMRCYLRPELEDYNQVRAFRHLPIVFRRRYGPHP